MLLRTLTLVSATSLFLVGCAPSADVAAEEEAVRATSARWLELSKQRDASGVAGLFVEDGEVHWEDRPRTVGPEAIADFMRRDFAENPSAEGEFGPDRIYVAASGDLAVEQGAYNAPNDAGRYITVYRKVGSDWKVAADMSVSASPNGGAPAWAIENLAAWYQRYNARDAQGIAALYTADARVNDARGRAAIIRYFRNSWTENNANCTGAYDDFVVVGSIAAGWGRDACTVTPSDGGTPQTTYSNWLAMYERQADGSWLCIRDFGEDVGS